MRKVSLPHARPFGSGQQAIVSSAGAADEISLLNTPRASNSSALDLLRESEDESRSLRLANSRLKEELGQLQSRLADCEERLRIANAIAASGKDRAAITQRAEETRSLVAAGALASQLERLAAANEKLRAELTAERASGEARARALQERHEAFLLNVAGEFSQLESSHAAALERIRVLEERHREAGNAQTARLAAMQRNNAHMMERQYLRKSTIAVDAPRGMAGNSMHDRIAKEEQQPIHGGLHAPNGGARLAAAGGAGRPPTAPSHYSTMSLQKPFSRLEPHRPTSARARQPQEAPPVLPRHTMTELLAKYHLESLAADGPRTAPRTPRRADVIHL